MTENIGTRGCAAGPGCPPRGRGRLWQLGTLAAALAVVGAGMSIGADEAEAADGCGVTAYTPTSSGKYIYGKGVRHGCTNKMIVRLDWAVGDDFPQVAGDTMNSTLTVSLKCNWTLTVNRNFRTHVQAGGAKARSGIVPMTSTRTSTCYK